MYGFYCDCETCYGPVSLLSKTKWNQNAQFNLCSDLCCCPFFFVLCNTDQPYRQLATCSIYDWHITTVETAAIFCPYPHKYQQGKERWTEKKATQWTKHVVISCRWRWHCQYRGWFLMAILSFRHKPLFTIIHFFFTIIHFGDSKVNSVTLVQNRLLWIGMGEFRSVCVYVCFFWSSSVIKTKISNYITPKSELYRFDWMYCGKWERSALKIIEIKKRREKNTLSHTRLYWWFDWIEQWLVFGINSPFSFVLNWTQCFFFEKKRHEIFTQKNPPHKWWV